MQEFKDPARAEEAWRFMVAASGKLSVLQQMLPRLLAGGHRVLVFSQSVEVRWRCTALCCVLCAVWSVEVAACSTAVRCS